MQNLTYSEKLKDPRWQKKRLEIFERDGFACRKCYDDENTLHVHHLVYSRGKDPWEYENDCLMTLCEECHRVESEERPGAEEKLLNACRGAGFGAGEINALADAIGSRNDVLRGNLLGVTEPHCIIYNFLRLIEHDSFWSEIETAKWDQICRQSKETEEEGSCIEIKRIWGYK